MDIKELLKRCVRIFHISRKPTPDEFQKVFKITAFGAVVIGVIGVAIAFVFKLIN